ncbi:hypothetical protein LCGC14_2397660 [marine sediment metagenome]|uniref:Uncharacterized protein n=1 Tax=marine sediment metagenome TaxID=412755 RepID=A0A0F9E8Q7_9ZZZZ
MTNSQEKLCNTIARMSEKHPHLRVMQLISNAIPHEVHERLNGDFYYVEDEALTGYLLAYEADTLDRGEI